MFFIKEEKGGEMIQVVQMFGGITILTFDTPHTQTEPSIMLIKDDRHLLKLLRKVDEEYACNRRKILIGLTGVAKIDSEAATEFLMRGSKAGIRICFYDMRRSVRNLFKDIHGFSLVFDIYGSEEDAIQSFK